MDSLDVLRTEPSLTAFPLIAGVAGAIYLVLVLGGAFLTVGADPGIGLYAALFILYLGSAFIASFFTAALMYNAREVFRGEDPTLGDGLRAAWRNKGPLLAWALISAIVGMIFRALERRGGPLGDIAGFVFGIAWSIVTYFIIPVIVFEEVSVSEMFSRSGETFKETWGETVGAGFGVGLVTVLFLIVGLALALLVLVIFGGTVFGFVGAMILGAAVLLVAYLGGSALTGISKTALYIYATEGEQPQQFEDVDFSHTVE